MDKKKFFERYSKIFDTIDFKSTYKKWQSLSKNEKDTLTKETSRLSRKKYLDKHPDHYKNISEKLKGRKVSEETKQKISASNKKYYERKESRQKTSKALKSYYASNSVSEERRKKQRESLIKTYIEHPELKKRISDSVKRWNKNNPNVISQKTKEAMKEFYSTEKGQENLKKWTNASKGKGTSSIEKSLQEFVKSIYNNKIDLNTRAILSGGKELDIYIPDKKVAVEMNGNIWHSEAFKKDNADKVHLEKTLECEKLGIRLIHVFSDEWEHKQDIIKSIIASAVGVYDKKYFARDLTFKEVSSERAKDFFNNNHIQGNTPAAKYYGLFYYNNLIQAISVGYNRFTKDKNLELIRMATRLNTQVVGGFSKLIKNALKYMNLNEIESYVDRRIYNAKGYLSSGWFKIGESSPRYFYTDGAIRENRQKYMKKSCIKRWNETDTTKTEHQMCLEHGLYRIFDCGTIKMKFKLK